MLEQVRTYLDLIKFSHTLFALPFALVSAWVASEGVPGWWDLCWIIIAMAAARSGAMGFNRWLDRRLDADNPRTASRPSVTGGVTPQAMLAFTIIFYALLVLAASQLNDLALALSPVAIFLTAFYSWTKRFTSLAHLFLGLAIGSAPIAAWIAITGEISPESVLLGASVGFWIAGFDVLYALQDREFDQKLGLFSIPSRLGVEASLFIARLFHGLTVFLWGMFFWLTPTGILFLIGISLACGLLVLEHRLVQGGNLNQIDQAFFQVNGVISLLLFVATVLDFAV